MITLGYILMVIMGLMLIGAFGIISYDTIKRDIENKKAGKLKEGIKDI